MSKAERRTDEIDETRMQVFEREGWRCFYVGGDGNRCPKRATQAAHILPQDVLHIARYGSTIIHHPLNMRGSCPTHNAKAQINYRAEPVKADEHAAMIRAAMEEGND